MRYRIVDQMEGFWANAVAATARRRTFRLIVGTF